MIHDAARVGAYGFTISGVSARSGLLQPVPAGWTTMRVDQHNGVSATDRVRYAVGEDTAELLVSGGIAIVADRASGTVSITAPERLSDDALVHPYLAFPAAVANHWAGRCTLHAGAVVVDGRAWALVGYKEGGKSSTLGWMATQGLGIVTDDLLVVERGNALVGPRCVDLREETADLLGVGAPLGIIGSRPRFRVGLTPVPVSVPLAGWIFLTWGDELRAEPLAPAELLERILMHDALNLVPGDAVAYLDLITLPGWTVTRPRRLDGLPTAGRRILELIAATPTAAG